MRIDFQEAGYKEEVEKSIAFLHQGMDFYAEVKAQCLLEMAERRRWDGCPWALSITRREKSAR